MKKDPSLCVFLTDRSSNAEAGAEAALRFIAKYACCAVCEYIEKIATRNVSLGEPVKSARVNDKKKNTYDEQYLDV